MSTKIDARIEKYLASGGLNCPVCGKDNLEGDSIDISKAGSSQEVYCLDCESSWTDLYTLTGYADLTIGGSVPIGEDRPEVEASDIEIKENKS